MKSELELNITPGKYPNHLLLHITYNMYVYTCMLHTVCKSYKKPMNKNFDKTEV